MLKKLGLLRSYKTINDLPHRNVSPQALPKDRRGKMEICVIDDQSFDAGRNLRNFGYKFHEIGDIKKIDEVSRFPIVLCDLMGVGMMFDEKRQGASIIREIRRNYPSIMIAAYSGASASSEQAKSAIQFADKFIKKDADYDTWTQELDTLIKEASDTRAIWSRVRVSLVEDGIDTKMLLKLEDAYVNSLLKGDSGLTELKEVSKSGKLSNFATDIINGLISSAVFRFLTGV